MPPYFKVQYISGGVFTTIPNGQNVTVNVGRQHQLDQYNASTAQAVIRYPNGYVSPITELVPGVDMRIQLNYNGTDYTVFVGKLANALTTYGIPYVGSVGNADYLNLTLEGQLADFGRVSGLNYAMAAGSLSTQFATATTQSGYTISFNNTWASTVAVPNMPATTISTTWGDWINRVALTLNGRLLEDRATGLFLISPFSGLNSPANLSDVANDASFANYQDLTFTSLADNFYTQVTVSPESYAAQTVQTGSSPYRTYTVNTLNNSTGQALDYANYLLNNYKSPAIRISSARIFLNATTAPIPPVTLSIGSVYTVTFRGTTYNCVLEGYTYSGDVSETYVTMYFSPAEQNAYLILNDDVFGKLDSNRLGY